MKFKEIGAAVFIALTVLMAFHIVMVKAAVPGDVTGDGIVDINDVAAVAGAFGKKTGDTGYSLTLDLNGNGVIDIFDLVFVVLHYT